MLSGGSRRWVLLGIVAFSFVVLIWSFRAKGQDWIQQRFPSSSFTGQNGHSTPESSSEFISESPPSHEVYQQEGDQVARIGDLNSHIMLNSLTTPDKKYFRIKMENLIIYNPSIIAHPSLDDTFVVMAQEDGRAIYDPRIYTEMYCSAKFNADRSLLECTHRPFPLMIAPVPPSEHCDPGKALLNFKIGPSDGRLAYGPQHPYVIWRQQSKYTCMGIHLQDIRAHALIDANWTYSTASDAFYHVRELQRPQPWSQLEKNWFLFWDKEENIYAHYNTGVKRVFSKIEDDGSAGPDLAPFAGDAQCLADFMPKIDPNKDEDIHQATNALLITLCKRGECEATDENTIIFHIFQQKVSEMFHAFYEPHVIAFKRTAPFTTVSISRKPLWINGRKMPNADGSGQELLFITAMGWKHNPSWHGYLDDELFIAFGIEDREAGAIDVVAGTLFEDMAMCG